MTPKAVKAKETELQSKLDQCTSVVLRADGWTDRRMHTYLGITVHGFVVCVADSNLLAFNALPGSHTSQHIAEEIESRW